MPDSDPLVDKAIIQDLLDYAVRYGFGKVFLCVRCVRGARGRWCGGWNYRVMGMGFGVGYGYI
jgi:hypothetical protein